MENNHDINIAYNTVANMEIETEDNSSYYVLFTVVKNIIKNRLFLLGFQAWKIRQVLEQL